MNVKIDSNTVLTLSLFTVEIDLEYNRRMDMIMEVDRLKDIKKREEDEALKRMKRVEDRLVITEQIQNRQKQKVCW